MKTAIKHSAWQVCLLCTGILAALLFVPAEVRGGDQSGSTAGASQNTEMPPLPPSPIEQAERDGTALRISLMDLTKIALQSNLDIALSETNEEMYLEKIRQSYGYYDPAFAASLQTGSTKSANTNITNQSATGFNQRDRSYWNLSISQNIPTGGGVTVSFDSSRNDTNQLASLFTPQFQASTQIQFVQPLLRNRRIDQARSTIKLVNLDLQTNDSKFRQGVTNTIADIQSLYWDLVGAVRNYEIRKQSVELARILVEQNRQRVEIGTLAPITVTEALATQAARTIDLIRAREAILNTENNLRNMISTDRNADIWNQIIVPVDSPDFKEYSVRLESALQTALENRPELEQFDLQLQQNEITFNLQRNQKKWVFDFTSSLGAQGTAGPQSFDKTTGEPKIQPQFVGGLPTSYKTIFTEGLTNWTIGFNIQIPLRNRTADAQIAQTRISRRQLIMNRTKTEQNIIVQVRNAHEALETSRQSVVTARLSRQLAEDQLEGETERFESGISQNFQVLQRQTDLAVAQGVELQALIAYRKAIINLQQNMYNLLESNDFEIARGTGKSLMAFR